MNLKYANGKVVTFYSFKGGVGRTVTLKNTAQHLKKLGYRIAVIDMDTECPGYSLIHNKNIKISFFDLLSNFFDAKKKYNIDQAIYQLKSTLEKYSNTSFLELPAFVSNIDDSGDKARFEAYVNSLKKIERSFFEVVPVFLKALIDYLKKHYNYILIDTRTGLSEISLWNIRVFSNIVVWVLTLSEQNVKGIFYTFNRFSESMENPSPSFIFVSNISPPIPRWPKQRAEELFRYIHLRKQNLLIFPYAPEPIYHERFKDTPLNDDFKKVAKAILSVDPSSHLYLERYSKIQCKFNLIIETVSDEKCKDLVEFQGYKNLVNGIKKNNSLRKIYLYSILFGCLLKNNCYSLIVSHYLEEKDFILGLNLEESQDIQRIYHAIYFSLIKTNNNKYIKEIAEKIDNYYFGYSFDDILKLYKVYKLQQYYINMFYAKDREVDFLIFEEYMTLKLIYYLKQFLQKDTKNILFKMLVCWFLISNNTVAVTRYFWPPSDKDDNIIQILTKLYNHLKEDINIFAIEQICNCLYRDIKNNVLPEDIKQIIYQKYAQQ